MKRLLVLIGLLVALPLSAYEFKVGEWFQVQDEAVLKKAAELNDPALFIATDIPGFIDDGNSSLETYSVKGGYLVRMGFYKGQQDCVLKFMAPQFIPLLIPLHFETWKAGEVRGLRLGRTGKDPSRFNPNYYSLHVGPSSVPGAMLLGGDDPRRKSPCLWIYTELPFSEIARMFKSNALSQLKGDKGEYIAFVLNGKTKLKDILTPNALMKLEGMSANATLGGCSTQGPYEVQIKW